MKTINCLINFKCRFGRMFVVLNGLFLSFISILGQNSRGEIVLDKGWFIQSGSKVAEVGSVVSSSAFNTENWIPAMVPSTILGSLVNAGIYKDPFMGTNLEAISSNQFKTAWWYRTEFDLSKLSFEHAEILFQGINYYANIWLNGVQIASADTTKGSFRVFDFDITKLIHKNGGNILAIQVYPPKPGDFTMGFVDWTPRPNDKNMGLFRPVLIKLSGAASLKNIFVKSKVNLEPLNEAALTITADVINHTGSNLKAKISGTIDSIKFERTVDLSPYETRTIIFSPQNESVLDLKNPKLWWPHTMGKPDLYTLSLNVLINKEVSDKQKLTFGIREVSDYLTKEGYRGYKINGKIIQIRGGGWCDDLLLREDAKNLETQVLYTKLMNLNTIRLEGFWGCSQKLYDLCDRYGILIMVGWSCQWEWDGYIGKPADDFGAISTPEDISLVTKYWKDQILLFRNHPSVYVWVYGSDKTPRPAVEKIFLNIAQEYDSSRPTLASCKNLTSSVTGFTGVKMEGPYDYVTPNYWYIDSTHGGAYSFNTETGPGPQVPSIESLKKMIPADSLWPINNTWNFHCGRNEFNNLDRYVNAMDHRYGKATDLNDFEKKAQLLNYESIRPMFEAFAVNKDHATGIIQWMLNAAWPKLYWQLYDYYLNPNGAFYGTQIACRQLNIIFNYGDGNIYVSNDRYTPVNEATAAITVFDINSKVIFSKTMKVSLGAYTSQKIFDMPQLKNLSTTYFLDLRITPKGENEPVRNFYWLSTKKDVLDEEKSEWFVTPNKEFADFTSLKDMPKSKIEIKQDIKKTANTQIIKVELKNTSNSIAFFIDLKLKGRTSGDMVLPVYWNDNYISLLPGETRTIEATFDSSSLKGEESILELEGWNL